MNEENDRGVALIELPKSVQYFSDYITERARQIDPTLWMLSEVELEQKFRPNHNDYLFRKRINQLVVEAEAAGFDKIETLSIYDGVCTRQNFYQSLKLNPYRIVWLFSPVLNAAELMEAGFLQAIKKVMDEVLTMKITEKSAPVVLKALEFFTNRHLGGVTQKIEQKSLTMNVSRTVGGGGETLDPETMLQKYEETRRKLAESQRVIDVSDKAIEEG